MAEFVNSIDQYGDDVVTDELIEGIITEFCDDVITTIGYQFFYNRTSVVKVDVPAVIYIDHEAFRGCSNLANINIPNVNRVANAVFRDCTALTELHIPKLTAVGTSFVESCTSLVTVSLPIVTNIGQNSFYGCTALTVLDLPNVASILNQAFYNSSLSTLIIRNISTVCTLGTNAFVNTPIASGTGYIYVPRALVDSYKAATNWSTYATQFRALEDYTVDGTITGELDENKI